jgi:hypothetical protein
VIRIRWVNHLLAGSTLSYGFFASLWKVSSGRWIGYGDAKLAFPLGLILGIYRNVYYDRTCLFGLGQLLVRHSLFCHVAGSIVKRGQSTLTFSLGTTYNEKRSSVCAISYSRLLGSLSRSVDVLWFISYVLTCLKSTSSAPAFGLVELMVSMSIMALVSTVISHEAIIF